MSDPMDRVAELNAQYGANDVSAAWLLCDQHDPAKRAFRILGEDLSADDITYGELKHESEKFAAALQALGLGAGDRVATLTGKGRAYIVALVGIWRLGAVHVPLFTAFAPPAIAVRLIGSGAKVVIADPDQLAKLVPSETIPADAPWQVISTGQGGEGILAYAELMAAASPGLPAAAMGGNAPFIQVYTSGTTGAPKGVVVPIKALAAIHGYGEFGFGLTPGDIFWCAADPGWAYGLYYAVVMSLAMGQGSLLLSGGFSAERTFAVLAQERVTNFAAAPTVYRSLRTSGVPIPASLALQRASSAGEPLTPEVNEWAEAALGLTVHDHYGQTEAGMLINNHHHASIARPVVPGSMGQAMPGWYAVILAPDVDAELGPDEPGRLAFDLTRSPFAWFAGYDGDPAKSAGRISADGRWYLTGDSAMVDGQGNFRFSARDDDVIIMAGYRIGPFEVESALATHPAVAESAVIAVPDALRGEVIEAYVVLREGHAASAGIAAELQQWVKANYAAHAFPRAVHFIGSLPKTPSGKIQRYVLKAQRRAELAAG